MHDRPGPSSTLAGTRFSLLVKNCHASSAGSSILVLYACGIGSTEGIQLQSLTPKVIAGSTDVMGKMHSQGVEPSMAQRVI